MKIARLPLQVLSLFLQVYFFIETVRLHAHGYVLYMGEPVESAWSSMLFTLLIVVACEIIAFADAGLYVISKHNFYSIFYLILIIINAVMFMEMAYYSTIGTTICLSFYAIVFVFRVVNLFLNFISIPRDK